MMKKLLFILFSIMILSCSKDDKSVAYYNFRGDDFDKLLTFELNEIITYKNQFGDEIFYEVYESNSETMTIDGVDYENVYTIQSYNPNPIITSSGVEKNIHKIYYSKKGGVIGFDDLNNVQWRIVN